MRDGVGRGGTRPSPRVGIWNSGGPASTPAGIGNADAVEGVPPEDNADFWRVGFHVRPRLWADAGRDRDRKTRTGWNPSLQGRDAAFSAINGERNPKILLYLRIMFPNLISVAEIHPCLTVSIRGCYSWMG